MTETEARAIAAPDSWPWPMSREAQQWVATVEKFEQRRQDAMREQFNRAEHERFMRGLR
jgi:hypothetical protein